MAGFGEQRRRSDHQNFWLQVLQNTRNFISHRMHITLWVTLFYYSFLSFIQPLQIRKMQFENG